MTVPALFHLPPQPAGLTPNQQTAWDLITRTAGGVTADEIGAQIHASRMRNPHSVDERCEWCASTGKQVCRSKALAPLVVRRKASGKWEPRNPAYRAPEPTSQLAELPGDTFESIFERKAS